MKIHSSALRPDPRRCLALIVVCSEQLMIVLGSTIVNGSPKQGERAQAMRIFTLVVAGGGSIGLLAGGLLTESINWHWIFFIILPIGLATFVAGVRLIDETDGIGIGRGVDVTGSILVTAAMVLGVYAIVTAPTVGWTPPHTLGFGGAAAGLLGASIR